MPSQSFTVTIERLSYGPAGIGRVDGKVIFVPGTVPGDTVEVVIEEEKKTYAIGRLVALKQPSAERRSAPCPYIPRCGGCPWQHVTYAEQLRAKQASVEENMRRIGGLTEPPVLPIIPSPDEWHYRHRIRLRTEPPDRLGFYQARSHELVEIESCLIASQDSPDQLRQAREWLAVLQTIVRRVELLTEEKATQTVLVGNAEGVFHEADDLACERFLDTHPAIAGLVLFGRGWRREWGETQISLDLGQSEPNEHNETDEMDDLSLSVSSGTFTQVNLAGNRILIETLLHLADFDSKHQVLELYCGAGNLTLPLAYRVQALTGIEQDRLAVANARENVARLGLLNVEFMQTSVRKGLDILLRNQQDQQDQHKQAGRGIDTIVLDPPRAGAADIIDRLPRFGAQQIVYISCDPTTLARDLRSLGQHGYRVVSLQPIDLFPQTYHVETIAIAVLT
jgi:23S rRNA (uracil1939-C5)-methyltransferase